MPPSFLLVRILRPQEVASTVIGPFTIDMLAFGLVLRVSIGWGRFLGRTDHGLRTLPGTVLHLGQHLHHPAALHRPHRVRSLA